MHVRAMGKFTLNRFVAEHPSAAARPQSIGVQYTRTRRRDSGSLWGEASLAGMRDSVEGKRQARCTLQCTLSL